MLQQKHNEAGYFLKVSLEQLQPVNLQAYTPECTDAVKGVKQTLADDRCMATVDPLLPFI